METFQLLNGKFLKNNYYMNSKLKAEFEHFKQLYSSNKNNINVDDRYFSTLIPNAKKKIIDSQTNLEK